MEKQLACDKLREIANWLDYMDENFNNKFKSIADIERCYDACQAHSLEFADTLDWCDADDTDEEYVFAKEVNNILGFKYYNV